MKCPYCQIDMVIGQAIDPVWPSNARFVIPPKPSNGHDLKIIKCWKCPKCGHSDDGV